MNPRRTLVALASAGALLIGACSGSGEGAAGDDTVAAAEADGGTTAGVLDGGSANGSTGSEKHSMHGTGDGRFSSESESLRCPMHMPGDVLSAEDAIVTFDAQHVCLGYVTVAEGTPVRFHNTDPAAWELELLDDDRVVTETVAIGPDEVVERTFDRAGMYYFTYSGIADFVGTVEVQKP